MYCTGPLKVARVTRDPSAVRTREMVTCGGTGAGVAGALMVAVALGTARPGEAAGVLAGLALAADAVVDGEVHAAAMQMPASAPALPASAPAARSLAVMCFLTGLRMPRAGDRSIKDALFAGPQSEPAVGGER
jgi:hypothetical protein